MGKQEKKDNFTPHAEDPMLSLAEAGRLVGRSAGSIKNWIKDGLLRAVRDPSGLSRIRQSELEKFYGATALASVDQDKREREAKDIAAFHERLAQLAADGSAREEQAAPNVSNGAHYNHG